MVYVKNAKGDHVTCRLLLDTRPELFHASERCIQALGLTWSASRRHGKEMQHAAKPRISNDRLVVYAVGRIISSLERQNIDASTLEVFEDLQLENTHFNANTPVDILLGQCSQDKRCTTTAILCEHVF